MGGLASIKGKCSNAPKAGIPTYLRCSNAVHLNKSGLDLTRSNPKASPVRRKAVGSKLVLQSERIGTETIVEFQEAVVAELQHTKLLNAEDQQVVTEFDCSRRKAM